jgi:hypothetical protein
MLSRSFWKSGVVEHNCRNSRLLGKLKPSDRVLASWPVKHAPGLDNKFVGC